METIITDYIHVKDEDEFLEKIYLKDIYYIETIKSTHYCMVFHKHGKGKIHADIKCLDEKTGGYFFKVKASTLINLSLVWKIHVDYRVIYFKENICCTYARRVNKELKDRLKIQTYRRKGE